MDVHLPSTSVDPCRIFAMLRHHPLLITHFLLVHIPTLLNRGVLNL
jgi:hypothetical protein